MRKIIVELAKKSVKDLEKELVNVQKDAMKLQIEMKAKPQKDTNMIAKKRTLIAQIATVLHEKKLFEASPKKETKS